MKFLVRKRRQAPAIIIISLIDILIVLLIFLMATTTFKQHPAVQLSLPESKQASKGTSEANLIVTVAKEEPHLYFGKLPVTLDKLRQELRSAVILNPDATLSIRADTEAPFGEIIRVMDAAKEVHVRAVNAFTKSNIQP